MKAMRMSRIDFMAHSVVAVVAVAAAVWDAGRSRVEARI
jgi:hypothetical protein